MDSKRFVLFGLLAIVVYSLWTSWQADYPTASKKDTYKEASVDNQAPDRLLPKISKEAETANSLPVVTESNKVQENERISVVTDVLNVEVDLLHGDIVEASLKKYPESVDAKNEPYTLLSDKGKKRYVANSSLFTINGQDVQTLDVKYSSPKNNYILDGNSNELKVVLSGLTKDGIKVEKEFCFTKGSYLIAVNYKIQNQGSDVWTGFMNTQLLRSSPDEDKSSMFHIGSYTGASYSNPGTTKYKKVSFPDMSKTNLDVDVKGGWIAMQQHYFLSAWIPGANDSSRFYSRNIGGTYSIGAVSSEIKIPPQKSVELGSRLYVGPEVTDILRNIAPGLDLTVDYGWLWFLSSILFSIMQFLHSFIGNWGWSIVLVTVLIKLAFYKLSATSYKSMASMRKLQPKLQTLRERYGDDKAKISQATMELYRKEKVNPLGGCLPIVIQIPVFIALYWVLLESVELRQAPFIFWINDLAAADPYHILPLIMGGTMLIQQKLNPAPPDPTQAKVMMFLPILFTALFWNFPSGLVLYWIVNNTLSILQQWYITNKYSDDKPIGKKLVSANDK